MNLGLMISRVKRQIPSLTTETGSDTVITAELNHGVDEVNLIAQVYKSYIDVSCVAEQQLYSLSSICPGYLNLLKSGIWWWDSNGKSKILFPKTRKWFDLFIRNWRDAPSVEIPNWYWVENDELGFYPKPSTPILTGNKNFRVYFLKKATPMDSSNNYPWVNTTSEFTALRCFDNAIIAYAIWKLSPAVFDKEGRNYNELQFVNEVKKASIQAKRRGDLSSDFDYYARIDTQSGFLPSY